MHVARSLTLAGLAAGTVMLGLMSGPAAANRGNDAETIRLLDDCHPRTFNAFLGAGACVGDGDTTLDEFLAELADGGHDKWRNNPDETHVDHGEGLHLVNRGGEFHTFTKVRDFSRGGCVPELNDALGLRPRRPALCARAFTDRATALPAGAESDVPAARLGHGHNHFQCMIHPWMQTTVEVRS